MFTQATGNAYAQDLMGRVRQRAAQVAAQDNGKNDLNTQPGQVETFESWPKPGLWESFKNLLDANRDRGARIDQATLKPDGQFVDFLALDTDGPYGMDGRYSLSAHSVGLKQVEAGSAELAKALEESRAALKEAVDGGFEDALSHHVELCAIVGLAGPKRVYQELQESRSFEPGTVHDWHSSKYGVVVEDVQTGRSESVYREADALRTPLLLEDFHLTI